MSARVRRAASWVTGPSTASSMSSTAATGCTSRTVEARNASSAPRRSSSVHGSSRTSTACMTRARVIDSRMCSSSGGVRRTPSRAQKNDDVGASSTRPWGVTGSASSNPRSRARRVACMLAA